MQQSFSECEIEHLNAYERNRSCALRREIEDANKAASDSMILPGDAIPAINIGGVRHEN